MDPYRLDRLAEELAGREAEDGVEHDLPEYVPLAHNNPHLTEPVFNVEDFLLSRSHTSLPDLRVELREYLSTLKEELVKLINDDYEAFISLSTDLRGEGARLARIKQPLATLEKEVLQSKSELVVIQDAIEKKLAKRAAIREEKALLHLLLKISESVTRLESMLSISQPEGDDPSGLADDMIRGNPAKHLNRVATEYTQLLYHTAKARDKQCAFVDEIQGRIQTVHATLSSDLDALFSSSLISLTDPSKEKELETTKSKILVDLQECLRTYDQLGLWRDAEEVLRSDLVRPFVKKTVFAGALNAPHSPLMPHTPSGLRSSTISAATPAFITSATIHPPRTPYTPYTSALPTGGRMTSGLSSMGGFGGMGPGKTASPYAHLLETSDDPLAHLYTQLLRFVERDLGRIMEVAEKVSVKSSAVPALPSSIPASGRPIAESTTPQSSNPFQLPLQARTDEERFHIMANVIWEEFARSIMDDLGSTVFAAGRPSEFKRNHHLSTAFIRSLEFHAASVQAVASMRSHRLYADWEKRWQLPVYFQMRWKEIVGKVEEALSAAKIEGRKSTASGDQEFETAQAEAIWIAITACWSSEIYVSELGHRFWRLTLQLLSRFRTWLEDSQPLHSAPSARGPSTNNTSLTGTPTNSRSATPNNVVPTTSNDSPVIDTTATEDSSMRQAAAVIADIRAMESSMWTIWREEISMMLPEPPDEPPEEGLVNPEQALTNALDSLSTLIPTLLHQITEILTKRSCDALMPVRSIPSQFRAMSSSKKAIMPTEPSYFVSSILRPVRSFFGIGGVAGPGSRLEPDSLRACAFAVFEGVCTRYISYLANMQKTEESLRRLKKAKKSPFSLFGSATDGAKDDEGRDQERIRVQMILDVEAFGNDAKDLGVDVDQCNEWQVLHEMVRAVDASENA